MQDIIVEKPYTFIPPHRGSLLPWLILKSGLVRRHLRKAEGVVSYQLHGVDNLKESMRLGHGVLLAPNHCRYADPLVMSYVANEAKVLFLCYGQLAFVPPKSIPTMGDLDDGGL